MFLSSQMTVVSVAFRSRGAKSSGSTYMDLKLSETSAVMSPF